MSEPFKKIATLPKKLSA